MSWCEVKCASISALIVEGVSTSCWPEFGGTSTMKPVTFNKCAKQRGAESACEWNCVMFMILAELVPLWIDIGYEGDLNGKHTCSLG